MRSNQDHINPLQVIASIITGLLILLAGLAPYASAVASDEFLPFIEPLQVLQERAYVSSAPIGQDEQLESPAVPIAIRTLATDVEEETRLEALAKEKQQALSLEETAQAQTLQDELEQFGYDIFNTAPSTFAPVEGIPVPPDYLIGPGDNIVVQLFGKRNVEYNLVVTRDGKVLIPEFGPVAVGGLTFDDAESLITNGFEQRVIGARAVVTMGKLRTIQIRLSGDVNQPGIYTVGGLSSLIDALLTTGGVSGTGTLRDIRLVRNGRIIARLDLYELLLEGKSGADTFLRHNDTIFVPAIGEIVYVGGEVQRPAIYELRGETQFSEVIAMAGGLLPTASLKDSLIERIKRGGSRTVIDFHSGQRAQSEQSILATQIRSGDLLRILPLEDELKEVVLLQGHVERPGAYEFEQQMRLSTLLRTTESMLPGVDMNFAIIEREDRRTLRSTVLYASPMLALENPGTDSDIFLNPRDRVQIFRLNEDRESSLAALRDKLERQATDPRSAPLVEIRGALRHTGRVPLAQDARLLDVITLGGGLRAGADTHVGFIARTEFPSLEVRVFSFSVESAQRDPFNGGNPSIQVGDRVYVLPADAARSTLLADEIKRLREQARFGEAERIVRILGEVLSPGDYPLIEDMRASDLLCAARGLSRRADGVLIQLSRSASDFSGTSVNHQDLDSGRLMALCAEQRRADRGELGPDELMAFNEQYLNASLNPVLRARDQLAISTRPGWVEQATVNLIGEVHKPGVYVVAPGETLCEVLKRAGGLTKDAYTFGAEFTRVSVRELQQKTLDELHDQLDDLMVELSLSHSFNNEQKVSHEWGGKQDTLKVIRQLERAEANGRMVVDMDRVQRCRGRDALVLENGDQLLVPRVPNHVQVAGQVYVTTSHLYDQDRTIRDYVELSGGHTVLGRIDHTYVVQANGEVLNLKGSRSSKSIARKKVMPGARIYVPLNVDRMNPTEKAQSWVSTLAQSAILAGILL